MINDYVRRLPGGWQTGDIEAAQARCARALGLGKPIAALRPYATAQARFEEIGRAVKVLWEDLALYSGQGLDLDPILKRIGALKRAISDTRDSNTFVVYVLGNCAELATWLHHGALPQASSDDLAPLAPGDVNRWLAIGRATHLAGLPAVALWLFAELFPEHAAKLDRESVNRLLAACLERNRAQWVAAAQTARERLNIHVGANDEDAADTVRREMRRSRDAWLKGAGS